MNPFDSLKNTPRVELFDQWEGQFACQTYRCNGYALIADYDKKDKLLKWICNKGHVSFIEDVDE